MKRHFSIIVALASLAMALPSMAATYSRPLNANFGVSNTGKTANMTYKVIDSAGSTLIAATNTGVSESPSGSGIYHVTAAWDDTWTAAEVQWIDTTDSLYAATTVTPTVWTATNAALVSGTNTRVTTALPNAGPSATGGLADLFWLMVTSNYTSANGTFGKALGSGAGGGGSSTPSGPSHI